MVNTITFTSNDVYNNILMEEAPHFRVRQVHELTDISKEDVCGGIFRGNVLVVRRRSEQRPFIMDFLKDVSFFPEISKPINSDITAVGVSKCGEYVVSGHANGELYVWSVSKRKFVASAVISAGSAITNITFLNFLSSVVTCANNEIHRVEISNMLMFSFVKSVKCRRTDDVVVRLESICSKDASVVLIAAGMKDHIAILNEELEELSRVDSPGNSFAFTNKDWHGYLIGVNGNDVVLYKVFESGEVTSVWTTEVDGVYDIVAISNSTFIALKKNAIVLIGVHHGVVTTYENVPNLTDVVCSGPLKVFLLPSTIVDIETVNERMDRLHRDGLVHEAIETGVACMMNELPGFSCVDRRNLQDNIQRLLCELAQSGNGQYIRDIASSFVVAELFDVPHTDYFSDLCQALNSHDYRLQLLVAMLQTESIGPDYTEIVVRKIAEMNPVGDTGIESVLMECSFTRSFVREALAIGSSLKFPRFLVKLFNGAYNDILPPFASIVDTGFEESIMNVCEYVFLNSNFDGLKVNMCIVWLHAPNTDRLSKVIHACSSFAKDLVAQFVARAPIPFGATQDLTEKDIVRSVFLCFGHMEPPMCDDLFLFLAEHSISKDIPVPSQTISHIIPYIFETSASSRALREKFLLKIVDNDYAGQIDLQLLKMNCVKCGFWEAGKRLWHGADDLNLQVQCLLLSDHPEEAFELFSSEDVNHDYAQSVFSSLLRPLLYSDPERTVRLIHTRFTQLHRRITSREGLSLQDVKRYFDTRFSLDPPIMDESDTKDTQDYLLFMKDHPNYIMDFMWNTRNINPIAVKICTDEHLYIGLAIFAYREGRYNDSFKWYQMHGNTRKGIPDLRLTQCFLDHADEISFPRSVLYEALLKPLALQQCPSNVDHIRRIVEDGLKDGHRSAILTACYLVYVACCSENPVRDILLEYIEKDENCYVLGSMGLFLDISHMIPQKDIVYAGPNISVIAHSSGVTQVSTLVECTHEDIAPDLGKRGKSLIQHAELGLMLKGLRVPDNTDALIIIDNAISYNRSE